MKTENLPALKIHKLSQAQYERELAAGRIDETAIYLTPDETVDLSDYATQEYVGIKVAEVVNSAPETLNTLNELAAALGDDPNFATTMTNELAKKVNDKDLGTLAKKSSVDKTDLSSAVQSSLDKADSAL